MKRGAKAPFFIPAGSLGIHWFSLRLRRSQPVLPQDLGMARAVEAGGVGEETRTEPVHGSLTGRTPRSNGVPDFPERIGSLACAG